MSDYMDRTRRQTGSEKSTDESGTANSLTQLTLDDLEAGRRQRDRGHQVSTFATDVAWTEAFDAALARWAARGVEFVSDDVIAEVGPPVAPSANVIGARMGAAARRGVIRRVGYRTSTKRSRNAGVVSVWRGTGGA